ARYRSVEVSIVPPSISADDLRYYDRYKPSIRQWRLVRLHPQMTQIDNLESCQSENALLVTYRGDECGYNTRTSIAALVPSVVLPSSHYQETLCADLRSHRGVSMAFCNRVCPCWSYPP